MLTAFKGKTVRAVEDLTDRMGHAINAAGDSGSELRGLGELAVLAGVGDIRRRPIRSVILAMNAFLGW
jgi:NifU-like protein involved in Fe-S cluster formation